MTTTAPVQPTEVIDWPNWPNGLCGKCAHSHIFAYVDQTGHEVTEVVCRMLNGRALPFPVVRCTAY